MARVPTIAEEDAKRPNRERECLVGERTRIVNRIKSTLARLGIRNFKPTQRKAADRLATMHTPEGMPLPPNTLAELQRDMARLGFVVSQIREIEDARHCSDAFRSERHRPLQTVALYTFPSNSKPIIRLSVPEGYCPTARSGHPRVVELGHHSSTWPQTVNESPLV
jgi:hypothetical protein